MKLKVMTITAALTLALGSTAFASDAVISYDFDNGKLLISGKDDADTMASIILTNSDNGNPYLITQTTTDADGQYEFSIDFDLLDNGNYSAEVYVGGEKYTATKYYNKSQLPQTDSGSTGSSGGGGSSSSGGSGGSSSGGSSSGGSSGGSVFAPVVSKPTLEEYTPASSGGFTDLSEEHWAYNPVMSLTQKGIISGIGDGLFGTDMNLTREQFAKLLIDTMKLDLVDDNISHTDVDKSSWSYPYLVAIYKYGIMEGYSDTELGVKDNILRQDLAVLIKRTLEVKSITLTTSEKPAMTDTDAISDYAKESVTLLYEAGLISGMEDGSFMPKSFVTRAQAAVILDKLLTVIGG